MPKVATITNKQIKACLRTARGLPPIPVNEDMTKYKDDLCQLVFIVSAVNWGLIIEDPLRQFIFGNFLKQLHTISVCLLEAGIEFWEKDNSILAWLLMNFTQVSAFHTKRQLYKSLIWSSDFYFITLLVTSEIQNPAGYRKHSSWTISTYNS